MKKFLAFLAMLTGTACAVPGALVNPPYDAPVLTAPDQDGNPLNLADVYAKGTTVVFFYPKASTPGCTKQACSLRDASTDLTGLGVQVIGVSADKPSAQKAFKDAQKLPYPLIADSDCKVIDAFKVEKNLLGMATRQAFIIKGGKVVWHAPKASTTTQADDIKAALKELKEPPKPPAGG